MSWLWSEHSSSLEFVALFGSRARGDALEDSDYDLLVGLREEDGLRLTDRIAIFQDLLTGKVQVLAYSPAELELMESDSNCLLLEALADGRALFDRGVWERMRAEYRGRIDRGELRRKDGVWEIFTSSPRG